MRTIFASIFAGSLLASLALAQEAAIGPPLPPPSTAPIAPYDKQLLRLSEVLGSLHYLRALCETGEGNRWRDAMNNIITLESPPPARRSRLISRFNRGFRALDETYTICTPSARMAADRYLNEGEELTSGIVRRYGR